MAVDRAGFLYIVGALAAGGAGGYYLNKHANEQQAAESQAKAKQDADQKAAIDSANQRADKAEAEAKAATASLTSAPVCDDTVGAVDDCPPAGLPNASDEGICGGGGSVAARRCKDLKTAMKPKVAQNAVSCLKSLKGGEVCDANRVSLCGHEALMMACQEPLGENQSQTTSINLSTAPPNPPVANSAIAQQCNAILQGCSGASPGITLADCYRTMSGLNDVGRANMMTCMKTHCGDKGLLGCEAMAPPNN